MGVGFVVAGSAQIAAPEAFGHGVFKGLARAAGIAAVVFFGLGVLLRLRRPGGGELFLLRPGIAVAGPFKVLIEWSNIARAKQAMYMGQSFVWIQPRDRTLIRAGRFARLVMNANRRLTGADLGIATRTLFISPDRLERILRRYVDDPGARERIGSPAELAALPD